MPNQYDPDYDRAMQSGFASRERVEENEGLSAQERKESLAHVAQMVEDARRRRLAALSLKARALKPVRPAA